MGYSPEYFPVQVDPSRAYDWGEWRGATCLKPETGWRKGDVANVWWDGNGFSQRRGDTQHNAMDLMAPLGATIVAARSGQVIGEGEWVYRGERRSGAGWSDRGGWYVRINTKEGGTDYYAHMISEPLVRPGEYVVAGQELGRVGQTGSARNSCPHLHYQVKDTRGRFVDPEPAMRALYAAGGWQSPGPSSLLKPTHTKSVGLKVGAVIALGLLTFWWLKRRA